MTDWTASQSVDQVAAVTAGSESIITGSGAALVAAGRGDEKGKHGDIDVFCYDPMGLAALGERFLHYGATLDQQEHRKWERWMAGGFSDWHTNSLKLEMPKGVTVNLVHKTLNRRPLDSPEAVLGSFDFGYVAVGWDQRTGAFFDGRKFWLPDQPLDDQGFLPHRERAWLLGRVGKFMGIRQPKRWANMANNEWNMRRSQGPLAQGLRITASYYVEKDDPELRAIAPIYLEIADLVDMYAYEDILEAYKNLLPHDPVGSLTKGLNL